MKKILLDENLPKQLKNLFSKDFEILTVPDLGWQSKKNGELLTAIDEKEIEYLLTVDKNLQYQQNLEKFSVKVVVLFTYDNRFKTLSDKVSIIEATINKSHDTDKIIHIDLRYL